VVFSQKPNAKVYQKNSGIKLHHLSIPLNAGASFLPKNIRKKKSISAFRKPASISIEKKSGTMVSFSANGSCVSPNGMIISYNDPAYSTCISERSFAKKIILDDPTQSILMNFKFGNFGF
tara:strand:+ start:800 stop:1159 length:360 start_codon:yes stop_codon:yes gene_type:complete